MWIVFLLTTLSFLSTSIALFFYLNRTAQYLFAIEDIMEEMAVKIAHANEKINKVNEMPVATDTPEIRYVVEAVREVTELISSVADNATDITNFKKKRRDIVQEKEI